MKLFSVALAIGVKFAKKPQLETKTPLENLNIAFGLPFSIPPQDYIGH